MNLIYHLPNKDFGNEMKNTNQPDFETNSTRKSSSNFETFTLLLDFVMIVCCHSIFDILSILLGFFFEEK